MGKSRKAKSLWFNAGLLALLALVACGDDAVTSEAGACVVGQAVVCACDNGTNGAQLCGRDGMFGGCFCIGPAAALDGSVGGEAGSGAGGTKAGAGGSSTAGDSGNGASGNGASGNGASGNGGAGGGAGAGATGGAGKSGGGGAAGGAAGSAGSGTAGKGGTGGSSGSGGAGGVLGAPYARCNSGGLCRDGSLCVDLNQGGGSQVGYCAPVCMTHADGTVSKCPQPMSGDVEAFCLPFANMCVLGSCSNDVSCPRGMTCADGNAGPGNQQPSCVYPAR